MKRFNPYLLILTIYIVVAALVYFYFRAFGNSNLFLASITFLVGSLALYVYTKQKMDTKRDAAKLIIQEIRRAEDIVNSYKEMGVYTFQKKIIATNSWTKNIHYFVGDLDNDELDKISELYSTGEYLDSLIHDISNITFTDEIEQAKFMRQQQMNSVAQSQLANNAQVQLPPQRTIIIPQLPAVWRSRLDLISNQLQPIYHSSILQKLKKIAGTF